MAYKLELELRLGKSADQIHGAVELDNENFIRSHVSDGRIVAVAESGNLMSLLRSADVFISCVQVAERAMRKTYHP